MLCISRSLLSISLGAQQLPSHTHTHMHSHVTHTKTSACPPLNCLPLSSLSLFLTYHLKFFFSDSICCLPLSLSLSSRLQLLHRFFLLLSLSFVSLTALLSASLSLLLSLSSSNDLSAHPHYMSVLPKLILVSGFSLHTHTHTHTHTHKHTPACQGWRGLPPCSLPICSLYHWCSTHTRDDSSQDCKNSQIKRSRKRMKLSRIL